MIFAAIIFLTVGLGITAVPALMLGLTTALLSRRLRLRIRICLVALFAVGTSTAWAVILRGSYLLPAVIVLVAGSVLVAGAAGIGWTACCGRRAAAPFPGATAKA